MSLARVIPMLEQSVGAAHPATLAATHEMAEALDQQKKYVAAEAHYLRVLAIRDAAPRADADGVYAILNQLSQLYASQGELAKAEPLLRRKLDADKAQHGESGRELLHPLMHLGGNQVEQRKYESAEAIYKQLDTVMEKNHGKDGVGTITPRNALAMVYRLQGRYADAEKLLSLVLQTREKKEGVNHPGVAASLNNLASLLALQGRHREAEPLYVRALQIGETEVRTEPESDGAKRGLASTLEQTSAFYRKLGRDSEAHSLEQQSRSMRSAIQSEPVIKVPDNWWQQQ